MKPKNNKPPIPTDKTKTTKKDTGSQQRAALEAKREEKEKNKRNFIEALKTEQCSGNVSAACATAKIARSWMYECRGEDEKFAKEWDDAVQEGYKTLEDMAVGVIYKQLEANDKYVAMFVLRQLNPKVWNKDREKVGEGGGAIEVRHKVSPKFAKIMRDILGENEDGSTIE